MYPKKSLKSDPRKTEEGDTCLEGRALLSLDVYCTSIVLMWFQIQLICVCLPILMRIFVELVSEKRMSSLLLMMEGSCTLSQSLCVVSE